MLLSHSTDFKKYTSDILDILCQSFDNNKSVNFVVKQDKNRKKRLYLLMRYSLFLGKEFGYVFYNENHKSCAILLDPKKKKTTFKSILWDLRLVFQCMGIGKVSQVLKREAIIKKLHPKTDFLHLWYLGVALNNQGKGYGSNMLQEIDELATSLQLPIYLETSTEINFPFYEKNGYSCTNEISSLGYVIKTFVK
jgi:GNAT superfamily N-acetyltransferase